MVKKYIFNVQTQNSQIRLDSYLAAQTIFNSRNQIQNLIKKELVFVNGEVRKASFKVMNDDEISVILNEDFSPIIEKENIKLDILYEDNEMLVINKPKNMLTHPTAKETKGTLVNALLFKYGYEGLSDMNGIMRPGIIHRLDRNTSGLLMVAKTNHAHEILSEEIKTKTAKRKYLAIVHGNFDKEEGTLDFPIERNPKKPEQMAVIEGGKPSVTHYKVIEQFKGFSYIELSLETGRTHQIRVHMNYINHPIINDSLYNKIPFKVKTQEQALQSYFLQFKSVINDDIIKLEIQPDNDIQKVLKYLRSIK